MSSNENRNRSDDESSSTIREQPTNEGTYVLYETRSLEAWIETDNPVDVREML